LQCGLSRFAFAYISRDRRKANQRSICISKWRNGNVNIDRLPILSEAHRLKRRYSFTGCDARQQITALAASIGRKDGRGTTPDDLPCRISVNFFRSRVPGENDIIKISGEDRVVRAVDERGHVREPLLRRELTER
jgi:hypothetical protein